MFWLVEISPIRHLLLKLFIFLSPLRNRAQNQSITLLRHCKIGIINTTLNAVSNKVRLLKVSPCIITDRDLLIPFEFSFGKILEEWSCFYDKETHPVSGSFTSTSLST